MGLSLKYLLTLGPKISLMFGNPNLENSLAVLSTVYFIKLDIFKLMSSKEFIKFTNSTGLENLAELLVIGKRDKKNQFGYSYKLYIGSLLNRRRRIKIRIRGQ